jgi:tRNA threonylcarbamoyladenosine modification (KEOPS) complex  Pcc1 subunit
MDINDDVKVKNHAVQAPFRSPKETAQSIIPSVSFTFEAIVRSFLKWIKMNQFIFLLPW